MLHEFEPFTKVSWRSKNKASSTGALKGRWNLDEQRGEKHYLKIDFLGYKVLCSCSWRKKLRKLYIETKVIFLFHILVGNFSKSLCSVLLYFSLARDACTVKLFSIISNY